MILRYQNTFKLTLIAWIMTDNEKVKMAVIAGAACAMRYKELHPNATESEVLKYVSKEVRNILEQIENY